MEFYALLLLAVGLSMDAFAVSVCKGITVRNMNFKKALLVGFYFGFFQALMPLIGFLLTGIFSEQIKSFDHWVAFGLLLFIGIKMLIEAFEKPKDTGSDCNSGSVRFLVMIPLAVATSIDALAAGIALSIANVRILYAIAIIGVVTFVFCTFGAKVGCFFGKRFQKLAEILGGIILVLLGIKILLDHLELIKF